MDDQNLQNNPYGQPADNPADVNATTDAFGMGEPPVAPQQSPYDNVYNNTYEQPTTPPESQKTDTLAVVSLVLGIAAIVLSCCITYLGIALGVGGIICAVMSKKKQKSGLATAGLVCSIIAIVVAVLLMICSVALVGWLASEGYDISSLL